MGHQALKHLSPSLLVPSPLPVSTDIYGTPFLDGTQYPFYPTQQSDGPLRFLAAFNKVRTKPWEDCGFLDLCCHEGQTTFQLAQSGAQVVGVDPRPNSIAIAQYKQHQLHFPNIRFHCGELLDPCFWGPLDGVYLEDGFYFLDSPEKLFPLLKEHVTGAIWIDNYLPPSPAPQVFEEGDTGPINLENTDLATDASRLIGLPLFDSSLEAVHAPESAHIKLKRFLPACSPTGSKDGFPQPPSYWLTEKGLLDALAQAGFHTVEKDVFSQVRHHRGSFFATKLTPRPENSEISSPLSQASQSWQRYPLPPFRPLNQSASIQQIKDLERLKRWGAPILPVGTSPYLRKGIQLLEKAQLPLISPVMMGEGDHWLKAVAHRAPCCVPLFTPRVEEAVKKLGQWGLAVEIVTSFFWPILLEEKSLKKSMH
ncbi:MAG: class I SAM-dependent methyltransferase [Cyanobacteria bacterium]|nr:class I SAM-dependent methyltransferase [Cyanobacteriota bacterium]